MSAQRIRKEIRTLFSAWVSMVGLVFALSLLLRRYIEVASVATMVAFIGGCFVLAALGFGSEYESKTLLCLLSQPLSRKQIWFEKMTVLTGAVLMFCFLTICFVWLMIPHAPDFDNITAGFIAMSCVALCAVCATPYLALRCRGPLVGAIVSIVLPIFLLVGATRALDRLHLNWPGRSYFWFCIAFLTIYALVCFWLGFRKFTRLQLVESRNFWERFSFSARMPWKQGVLIPFDLFGGPYARLIRKEIHLQSFSFLGALLFSIAWLLYRSLHHLDASTSDAPSLVCGFYTSIAVVIIGVFSIASERSMGTIPWQFMLPISRRKQWLVKLTVIGMTCLLLCVVVPLVVFDDLFTIWDQIGIDVYGPIWVLFLFIAIFSSSVSSTPVRAIIRSVAIIVCTFTVTFLIYWSLLEHFSARAPAVPPSPELLSQARLEADILPKVETWVLRGSVCSSVALMTIFSFLNYRELNLRRKRIYLQVGTLIALAALASLSMTCLNIRMNTSSMIIYQNAQPRVP